MVLVDSSIWIEGMRREGALEIKIALEALLEAYEATLCGPVKMEVLGGARREELAGIQYFFSLMPYYPFNEKIWEEAASLGAKMRGKGWVIPWNDLLVASVALQKGARVYARDKHFEQMAESVGLRLYRPGYGGSYQPEERDDS